MAPPLSDPQVAFWDTFFVDVEYGAVDVRVDEAAFVVDIGVLPPAQVPYSESQPVSQCASEDPHQPY